MKAFIGLLMWSLLLFGLIVAATYLNEFLLEAALIQGNGSHFRVKRFRKISRSDDASRWPRQRRMNSDENEFLEAAQMTEISFEAGSMKRRRRKEEWAESVSPLSRIVSLTKTTTTTALCWPTMAPQRPVCFLSRAVAWLSRSLERAAKEGGSEEGGENNQSTA